MLIRTKISLLVNILFALVISGLLYYGYSNDWIELSDQFVVVIIAAVVFFYFAVLIITYLTLQPLYGVIDEISDYDIQGKNTRLAERKNDDAVKWLIDAFNSLLVELDRSIEELQLFSVNVSHEVKNPLANILSMAEVALSKVRSSDDYKKVLKSIIEETQSLNYTVNQLLQLSKISTTKNEILFESYAVDELLMEVKREYSQRQPLHQLVLKINGLPQEQHQLFCTMNVELMKIALLNLISNACKFSADNKATLTMEVSEGDRISIHVIDAGPGIPEADQPHLFDLFFRGKEVKFIGGTGVGLPLVKSILDVHQMKLEIETSPEGTTMSLDFSTLQNFHED